MPHDIFPLPPLDVPTGEIRKAGGTAAGAGVAVLQHATEEILAVVEQSGARAAGGRFVLAAGRPGGCRLRPARRWPTAGSTRPRWTS